MSNNLHVSSAFLDPVSHSQQQLVPGHVLINPHQPHVCVHVDLKQIHLLILATRGYGFIFSMTSSEVICHVTAHLFVAVVEDEVDGGGEDHGHQTDTQAEHPELRRAANEVHVNGRVHSAPQHHIQDLQHKRNTLGFLAVT